MLPPYKDDIAMNTLMVYSQVYVHVGNKLAKSNSTTWIISL